MDALALRDRREIYRIDFRLRNRCRSRGEVNLPSQSIIVPLLGTGARRLGGATGPRCDTDSDKRGTHLVRMHALPQLTTCHHS